MSVRYEHLFEISAIGSGDTAVTGLDLWTGDVDIDLNGRVYQPTALVESVSIAGGQVAQSETRVTLGLFATTDALRSAFLQDPGPATVTLRQVASTDDGASWSIVPRAFTGRLTDGQLIGQRYTVDLVDRAGDPLRPIPLYWSDEDQQRRYSGDKGLQYMRQIAAGVQVQWP